MLSRLASHARDVALVATTAVATLLVMWPWTARSETAAPTRSFRRRVVAGVDTDGKSVVVADEETPTFFSFETPEWGYQADAEMWRDDAAHPIPLTRVDSWVGPPELTVEPPINGSLVRLWTWGAGAGTKTIGWHATQSIDYGVVLTGEIELHVERQEAPVLLRPGDVTVMRGVNHAWANRGRVPCTVAFVLVSKH